MRVSKTQVYDHVAQILHWTTYRRWREDEQEQTKITRIAVRYTFPQELAALLHYNGFTIIRQYGDWNLEPLTAASTSIIVGLPPAVRLVRSKPSMIRSISPETT